MRWFRFRLRTLFIAMTVISFAVYGVERWRTNRLSYLVDRFNELRDAGHHDQAAKTARLALYHYPEDDVAEFMVISSDWMLHEFGGDDDITSPLAKGTVCKFCGKQCAYPVDFERTGFFCPFESE